MCNIFFHLTQEGDDPQRFKLSHEELRMKERNKVPGSLHTLKEQSIQGKEKHGRVEALMGAQHNEREVSKNHK